MKRAAILIFVILSIFLLSAVSTNASRGLKLSQIEDLNHQSGKLGEYKALIIGISDYKDPEIPDLDTAVNDARALAEILQGRYGFEVTLLLERNATKEAIYKALRKFASSSKPSE